MGQAKTLHPSTRHKNYDKLTKKQHIGRELELWGRITSLELKLKTAKRTIRTLRSKLKTGDDPWKNFKGKS